MLQGILKIESEKEELVNKAFYTLKEKFGVDKYKIVPKGYEVSFETYAYDEIEKFLLGADGVTATLLTFDSALDNIVLRIKTGKNWVYFLKTEVKHVYVMPLDKYNLPAKGIPNQVVYMDFQKGHIKRYTLQEFANILNSDEFNQTENYIKIF